MSYVHVFIISIGIFVLGIFLEEILIRFFKKTHKFTYGKYLFFLLSPLISIILTIMLYGKTPVYFFVAFAVFGPVIEWLIGFGYHKIVNQRLWTYHRLSITGYTIVLTFPLWGFGGILMWLLAQSVLSFKIS